MSEILHQIICWIIGLIGIVAAVILEISAMRRGINGKSLSIAIGAIMFFVGLMFGENIINGLIQIIK